jgi:hypothetical protein
MEGANQSVSHSSDLDVGMDVKMNCWGDDTRPTGKERSGRGVCRGRNTGGEKKNWRERTARVEDRGPNPRVDAHVGPSEVEGPHRVRRVYTAA